MQYNLKYTYLELLPPDVFRFMIIPYAQADVPVFNANRQIRSPEFIYNQITGATVAVRRFEQAQISRFRSVPAGTCVVLCQNMQEYNVRTYPSGKLVDMGVLPIGFTYSGHSYHPKICISGNYIIKFIPEMPAPSRVFYTVQVREYGQLSLPTIYLSPETSLNIATAEYTTLDPVARVLEDKYLIFADLCYSLIGSHDPQYSRHVCPDKYIDNSAESNDNVVGKMPLPPNICKHEFCSRGNMVQLQQKLRKKSKNTEQYPFGSWTPHVLKIHRGNPRSKLPSTYHYEIFGNNTNRHSLYIHGNILSYTYGVDRRQVKLSYSSVVSGEKPERYTFYAPNDGDYMPIIVCAGNILYVFTRLTAYVVFHGRHIK